MILSNHFQKAMNERAYFKVIAPVNEHICFNTLAITSHFSAERTERHNKIVSVLGTPDFQTSFEVDKAHPNGNEIHTLFSNGVILIRNKRTGKVITELIARPAQIKRYWEDNMNAMPVQWYSVINKAYHHQVMGYNNW